MIPSSGITGAVGQPKFNADQEREMSRFFNKRLQMDIKDWNSIPPESPLWERCLSVMTVDYDRAGVFKPSQVYINEKSSSVLKREENNKFLKQFFCEHVITDMEVVKARVYSFINGLKTNQDANYTCVVPSNLACIISYNALITNLKYPIKKGGETFNYSMLSNKLKGRAEQIFVTDILLNEAVEQEKDVPLPDKFRGGGGGKAGGYFYLQYDLAYKEAVSLPRSYSGLNHELWTQVSQRLWLRGGELALPSERRQLRNMLVVSVAVIGCLAWGLLYKYK